MENSAIGYSEGSEPIKLTDNERIAKFMGLEKRALGIWDNNEYAYTMKFPSVYNKLMIPSEMLFSTSWDWLMPVVEKIEGMGFEVNICQNDCLIINDTKNIKEPITKEKLPYENRFEYQSSGTENSKVECTYHAVVEFIKWFESLKSDSK